MKIAGIYKVTNNITGDLELTLQEQDDFNYATLISATDDVPIINCFQNKEESI